MTSKDALFVGAALTATSVGITARVFGDLRALATTEARMVLGAAVADDVMGLVVLTVVVRLVTEGSVSVAERALDRGRRRRLPRGRRRTSACASYPVFFASIASSSRSTGHARRHRVRVHPRVRASSRTRQAGPIVGAFVAGLALGRSNSSERIRRELPPVGHLFIPVFFLRSASTPTSLRSRSRRCSRIAARPVRGRGRSASSPRPSGRSARPATSSSSGSACSPAARSG